MAPSKDGIPQPQVFDVNDDHKTMGTGTTTVALKCKDGIVIAADKRATAGNLIVQKLADKIHQIGPNVAVTIAGTVSDAQLLIKWIKAELNLKRIRSGREVRIKEAANLLSGMIYENIRKLSMIPGISHFLMGGKDETGYYLYDLFVDGSLNEVDDYVTSGSGSVFALGVLETLYTEGLSVEEGVKLAVKSINAALKRDTASGGGIDVMTITDKGLVRVVQKANDPTVTI
ncbi:proteasome subunit beta [Candidatus Woesearchaeota archaeon]|nr:proteasome subunit beta [Candidatus Woesearchaeota archaeon]